jgi:hypothetical protein
MFLGSCWTIESEHVNGDRKKAFVNGCPATSETSNTCSCIDEYYQSTIGRYTPRFYRVELPSEEEEIAAVEYSELGQLQIGTPSMMSGVARWCRPVAKTATARAALRRDELMLCSPSVM